MEIATARRRCGSSRPMWRHSIIAIATTNTTRPSFSKTGIDSANATWAVTASVTTPSSNHANATRRWGQNAKRCWNSIEPIAQAAHHSISRAGVPR